MLKTLYYFFLSFSEYFNFKIFRFFKNMFWYLGDVLKFKSKNKNNKNFIVPVLYPCTNDKTTTTPLDPIYFYQDTWAAKIIFDLKPKHHYDIGSSVKTIGILSQFVPVTMIDIRPIELKLNNLFFKEGSILNLPFDDNSVESVSSLCVVEHIGLGRYGDPLDEMGSEKSIIELKRITKPTGSILFSVPVSNKNQIYFNAHRMFRRDYVLSLFTDCELKEEKYIYGKEIVEEYNEAKEFGVGLFHFIKK